ncbi:Eco57I restriction-modification methylase domain-containing protein [Sedimentibacter sp. zth1]|uniref:Eco57I restriction-modification methylase domain-containing protein n=1 Tax=Sedimentibacter sp. zth1 TaxID=2816908 RepID=UPI001A92FB58|nr:TaqI-like C-terminal specificity domain-containing protein [Sedimentibacter sp. zth1]QSX06041.1 Eco57I restriction-modification methylase domain-containing protein [Sedimentibacter sp. zth1]
MEKILSKKIKEIICNSDKIDYIDNVRSSLYTISYIFFVNKFIYKKNFCEFIENFLENFDNCNYAGIPIFDEFIKFKFNSTNFERDVIRILFEFRKSIDVNNINIAMLYEYLLSGSDKKTLGQVYTPQYIIEGMVDSLFENSSVSLDSKFLDPACGGGYFLIYIFTKLKDYFKSKSILILNIEKHILENMIYGVDVDEFSIFLTKISLLLKSNICDANLNIVEKDFLFADDFKYKFDFIVGNPPYIGHKKIDKIYNKELKVRYKEVFYDKSDISYCFFEASKGFLKANGLICFISSRYFVEAKYADKLRNYINNNYRIIYIYDYNGKNIFKNALISPLVVMLTPKGKDRYYISINKYNSFNNEFETFDYDNTLLDNNGWCFLNYKQESLYEKINKQCNYKINDVCEIKQGIITGYDKAFIVTEEIIEKYKLERDILRKWIKNSNITKEKICYNNLYVIYTNLIDDDRKYLNTINYLFKFKNRLEKRRECISGVRKWYELQWGRNLNIFENDKIIFPYKAHQNTFYYDKEKYLCSADVYMLLPKCNEELSEYLVKYLNSNIFDFYFKCKAKKVGENLYEYYPNKLVNSDIYIPCKNDLKKILNNNKISLDIYLNKLFNISLDEQYLISPV